MMRFLSSPAKLMVRKNQQASAAAMGSDYGKFYSEPDSWNAMARHPYRQNAYIFWT